VRLGSGQGGFGQPAIFDIPGSTVDVLIAELTGDAHLDVAAVSNEGTVSVLRGDGAGGLIPGAEIAFHRLAWKLAAGLVTGDAIPDLVVSGEQEYLWPGVGNGQFGTPYSLEVIGESAGVVIAEMTGDGRNDVAFTVGGLNGVAVRARSGNEFAPGEIYGSGRLPVDVVAVDLDLDGRMDLVTADRTSDMIDVLLSVLPPTTGIPPVTAPARFVLGPSVPNPLVRGLPVRISIGEPSGLAWARVYDVSGRFIANLGHEPGLLTWDGRGVDGRPVPAGEYVVAVDGTRGQATCKLLVIP